MVSERLESSGAQHSSLNAEAGENSGTASQPGLDFDGLGFGLSGMVRPHGSRAWRNKEQMARGIGAVVLGAALLCACLSVLSGSGGSQAVELTSRGELEYATAQARAHLAADKVDLRNSAAKLHALNSLIAERKGKDDAEPFMVKGREGTALEDVKVRDENAEIMRKSMLHKAAQYEYKADEEAASIADAHLKGKKMSKKAEEEDRVMEQDDKMFARRLSKMADKGHAKQVQLSKQMKFFLNQYHNGYQLRMGRLHQEATYKRFQQAVAEDKQRLGSLLKQEATAQPSTKVGMAEQEAMAIESISKAVGN